MPGAALALAVLALAVWVPAASGAPDARDAKRAGAAKLRAFESCTGLVRYARRNSTRLIRDRLPLARSPIPVQRDGGDQQAGTPAPGPVAAPPATGGPQGGSEQLSSPTNVQETGIDEPDIVKAVGTRLYVISGETLHALDAGVTPPRLLGSLKLGGHGHELLVHGDRALVLGTGALPGPTPVPGGPPIADAPAASIVPSWPSRVVMREVDLSDPAAMSVRRLQEVEGNYVSARLTGADARVVIGSTPEVLSDLTFEPGATRSELRRSWRRSVRRARSAQWLPSTLVRDRRTGRRTRGRAVGCRSVRRPAVFSGLDTLTVLTIDLDRGLPAVDADSLMTEGETVYASPQSLYVATERWLGTDPSLREVRDQSVTALHRFDAGTPGRTAYRGSAEIPGYLLNQFSLSEHEGILRAATTDRPSWFEGAPARQSESAVRTLAVRDGRLEPLGRVGGLGKGERIFAVRFAGDIGFVVTFRETDPLYTLDLSDPAAPKLLGELKVPGYSAYLHPLGDGLLLGVGQDATETGQTQGTQVSLFDVADLRNPFRRAQLGFGESSWSPVEEDHHAFLWWASSALAVVPVIGPTDKSGALVGAVALRVDRAGGLREAARFEHGAGEGRAAIHRALVVGDKLLTVSDAGVMSAPLDTLAGGSLTRFP